MRDGRLLPTSISEALPKGARKWGYPLVLTGGFPCQDLSIAGGQSGLEGERSGLWKEFRRAIGEVGPDWVVIENVAHTWRKWVPSVRRDLNGLGYASLPLRVRASDLGAPHERARIYLVAHADREQLRKLSWWWLGPGREMAKELGRAQDFSPGTERAHDGLPNRVHRNRAIGNAIVPQIAQVIAEGIKWVSK